MSTVTVAWGDGQTEQVPVTGDADEWSFVNAEHTYAAPGGTYTITITGQHTGSTTVQVTVPDASEPALVLTVPATTPVQQGVQATYTTGLKNLTPTGVPTAVQSIRLYRTDGVALMPNQVTYETFDSGSWKTKTFARDGNDLVSVEAYPIPGNLDATSQVRITLTTAVGSEVHGRSQVFTTEGGDLLASADYKFTVAAP